MFIPLLIKNEKNMNNMSENFFQRSFNYSSIKKIYITNGFKVYKPTQDVYCDYFEGFCSYQGLKVRIEKKEIIYLCLMIDLLNKMDVIYKKMFYERKTRSKYCNSLSK